MCVVMINIVSNRLHEFGDAAEDSVADAVLREVAEPAFDDVQPRTAGGGEVQVEPRVSFQPRQYLGVFVSRVVIQDQVQVKFRWCLAVDLLQEFQPLLMSMSRETVRDDLPFGQSDRGE